MRDDIHRRSLLEVLALGMADLVCVAIHRCAMGFREPDRRAEVVDMGVGEQDRAQVVGAEAQLPQRCQHIVAAAGEPRVDQDHAAVVGDQCPVDQVGVREMDAVGDGRESRWHVSSVEKTVAELKLGYKASAEQFAPRELVELAVEAEAHGMDSATVSDHFQPWRHEGGHAPFSLAWMTAVGERTKRLVLGTSVLTPTFRYNPAVIAQAFATMGCLYPDRIFLGVGTGEALNEIATGYEGEWPEFKERYARLRESVRLMRELWLGDRVDFEGEYYKTKGASIYDVPDGGIPIYIAAGGPQVAKYAGRAGDGFICTSGKGEELYKDKLIPAVKEGAEAADKNPDDIDKMIEIKISYDPDPKQALENTRFWAPLSLTAEQKHSINDPMEMEKAADELPIEQVAKRWIVASDPDEAVEKVGQYVSGVSTIWSSTTPGTTSAGSSSFSRRIWSPGCAASADTLASVPSAIYIASPEGDTGKSTIALGIMHRLAATVARVGCSARSPGWARTGTTSSTCCCRTPPRACPTSSASA